MMMDYTLIKERKGVDDDGLYINKGEERR
jgi:hypothetical protein